MKLWPWRRNAPLATVPGDWHSCLQNLSPLYRRTPPALRVRTVELALRFIKRKHFVGCGGLQLTAAMQQLIAFQACLLVVEHGLDTYADLASVLLYPDAFVVEHDVMDAAGVVSSHSETLAGQAIDTMRVVLSWPDVLAADDGYNVVIHEFAHHLDHALDGALSAPRHGSSWHQRLEQEYRALCDAVDAGSPTLIDPYGSEDPAEFFAVASETFIELPTELESQHPDLYTALSQLYKLDPAGWTSSQATSARS